MMDVHAAPRGANGVLGLLGPASAPAPASGAAAARAPRGRQAFEDELDASLARRKDKDDDGGPIETGMTTAPPRAVEHRPRPEKRDAADANATEPRDPDSTESCAARGTHDAAAPDAPVHDKKDAAASDQPEDTGGGDDTDAAAPADETGQAAQSAESASEQGDNAAGATVTAINPSAAPESPAPPAAAEHGASEPQGAGNAAEGTQAPATARTPITAAVSAALAEATAAGEPAEAALPQSAEAIDAQPESGAAAQAAPGGFEPYTGDDAEQEGDEDPSTESNATSPAAHAIGRESFAAAVTQGSDGSPAGHDATQLAATPHTGAAATARLAEVDSTRATVTTASAHDTPAPDTTDRIVQSLRFQFQRGGGDAIVQIRPEHLGPLSISLRVENGSVQAHVTAENPVVAEWLKANEEMLRESLKESGLQLDRLVVHRDPDPSDRSPQRDWSQARREHQRRRFNDELLQSTFELTV